MSGHDDFFVPVEARVTAALGFRLALTGVAPVGEEALVSYVFALSAALNLVARKQRWTPVPAFPGTSVGIERVGSTVRLVCATQLKTEEGERFGVAFLTVVAGRRPQISVAPPDTVIPADWRELEERKA